MFFVDKLEYWYYSKFIAVPTLGAKVVNDVLEYPARNGRQLKLKFTAVDEKMRNHKGAAEFCRGDDGHHRLPTARELFDYCTAGIEGLNYGPNFEPGVYPRASRCSGNRVWAASLNAMVREYAWVFDGVAGTVDVIYSGDTPILGVRCVGPAQ